MSEGPTKESPMSMALQAGTLPDERQVFVNDIYRKHWPELCRYISKVFGGGPPEPEDVVQQAFVKFALRDEVHKIANPRAYLYKTARNIAVDHKRTGLRHARLQRLAYPDFEEEITDVIDPERVLMGKTELEVLNTAISSLSDRNRTFFLLNRLEGVSFAEIARRTGMSPSGVRLIVEQALEACQLALRVVERSSQIRNRSGLDD